MRLFLIRVLNCYLFIAGVGEQNLYNKRMPVKTKDIQWLYHTPYCNVHGVAYGIVSRVGASTAISFR